MIIHITAKAAQRKDQIWRQGDGLYAHVAAVPKNGESTAHLLQFLATRFDVKPHMVTLLKGARSTHKTVAIHAPDDQVRKVLKSLDEVAEQPTLL